VVAVAAEVLENSAGLEGVLPGPLAVPLRQEGVQSAELGQHQSLPAVAAAG